MVLQRAKYNNVFYNPTTYIESYGGLEKNLNGKNMNKLIEKFKRNELLDAEWFCNLFGKNVEDLPLKDALGPFGNIKVIGQLIFGKYRLLLIYDKVSEGLHQLFTSDAEMKDYILQDTEKAFYSAINTQDDYVFSLNIASTEDFGAFDLENAKDLLNKQLLIFIPIIQKFIVNALTDTFKIDKQE